MSEKSVIILIRQKIFFPVALIAVFILIYLSFSPIIHEVWHPVYHKKVVPLACTKSQTQIAFYWKLEMGQSLMGEILPIFSFFSFFGSKLSNLIRYHKVSAHNVNLKFVYNVCPGQTLVICHASKRDFKRPKPINNFKVIFKVACSFSACTESFFFIVCLPLLDSSLLSGAVVCTLGLEVLVAPEFTLFFLPS